MAEPYENMAEEQLRQDRAERRSAIEKGPGITAEQGSVKEVTAAVKRRRWRPNGLTDFRWRQGKN
jgi:hypothetical protein